MIEAIDWATGRAGSPPITVPHPESHSIVIAGDWAPSPTHLEAMRAGPHYLYGDLLPILRRASLAIVNLEAPFDTPDGLPLVKDGPCLSLPVSAIAGLTAVPFQVACLANNHILDHGLAGIMATRAHLEEQGISPVGAGRDQRQASQIGLFQLGGCRVAVINAAEGEEARSRQGSPGAAPLDPVAIQDQLARLRASTDLRIVIVHAGQEFLPVPTPTLQATYRAFVDAGASLVVGHHPHVAQGIELYRGVPIAYSLGNFLFPTAGDPERCQWGYLIEATITNQALDQLAVWPYEITPTGVTLLSDTRRQAALTELAQLSAYARDDRQLHEIWAAYADQWLTQKGLPDLAHSVALMTPPASQITALLQAIVGRYAGSSWRHRAMRSAIWRTIGLINRFGGANSHDAAGGMTGSARGAAVLHNRIETVTHRDLYLTALERLRHGSTGQVATPTARLVADWQR